MVCARFFPGFQGIDPGLTTIGVGSSPVARALDGDLAGVSGCCPNRSRMALLAVVVYTCTSSEACLRGNGSLIECLPTSPYRGWYHLSSTRFSDANNHGCEMYARGPSSEWDSGMGSDRGPGICQLNFCFPGKSLFVRFFRSQRLSPGLRSLRSCPAEVVSRYGLNFRIVCISVRSVLSRIL